MLKFYDASGDAHPLSIYQNLCVIHKTDGCNRLTLEVPLKSELYPLLAEECRIEYGGNQWLIKKIKDTKIECDLDFDFLKTRFYKGYSSGSRTLSQTLEAHLPDGWSIENGNVVSISGTIELDFCTDYDVIYRCMSTYGVYFVWSLGNRTVTVYAHDAMTNTGEYFTDELNLKRITFQGETTSFLTRLYCYGEEGLTFAEINDGKEYIDNNTYSDKIICGYWSDDRYADAESLLAAGIEKLALLAYPVRSYECDVVDLAKLREDYSFLDIKMHKVVTLFDRERKIKVEHRIVEYKEYPDEPTKNVVTLSSVPGMIQTSVQKVQSSLTEQIKNTERTLNSRVQQSTALLTNALGGHVLKRKGELLIMDTEDPATALKVWRWNVAGLGYSATGIAGPYSLAITADGKIVADFITAGELNGNIIKAGSVHANAISQEYKAEVTDEIGASVLESEQLFNAANGQLQSLITQLSQSLTAEASVRAEAVSSLVQTMNALSLGFTNNYTGGINLLRNSVGLNGLSADWEYSGTVRALQDSGTKSFTVSNSCFELNPQSVLRQQVQNVVSGRSYTLTLMCKKVGGGYTAGVKLIHDGTETVVMSSADAFGWQQFSVTVENTGSSLMFEAYCGAGDSVLYVSDIMLAEGNNKARWTPAPNEIYTTNVRIDRQGINISNTESDTETIIDNTRFAVKHQGETVITVNKDETLLKKSMVDADLTVGKLKFLPKDNRSDGLDIILLD